MSCTRIDGPALEIDHGSKTRPLRLPVLRRVTPNGPAGATPAAPGTPSPRKARRAAGSARAHGAQRAARFALEDLKTDDDAPPRRVTGIAEFDRVCGGGLVPGSALLIGGDPGVGKSTLLLQALAAYAQRGGTRVYISGEEAMAQVRLRAARMGLADAPVQLGAATCVEDILATLEARHAARTSSSSIPSRRSGRRRSRPRPAPSRRCAPRRTIWCATPRRRGAARSPGRPRHQGRPDRRAQGGRASGRRRALFRGRARPSFPHPARGEEPLRRHRRDRRLRDDRHGPRRGRQSRRRCSSATATARAPGAAVFAGIEGTRPAAGGDPGAGRAAGYGTPRRAVVGWDTGRLAMILAVLDARGGLGIGGHDVYLNVAGGLKIGEPAADLAAAAALVSSLRRPALPQDMRVLRRDQPLGRRPPGAAGRAAAEGSRQARAFNRASSRRARRSTAPAWRCAPVRDVARAGRVRSAPTQRAKPRAW